MKSRDLEFRGINREHLGMYFEELGANKRTNTFPYLYVTEDWSGIILSEKEIAFTAVLKVKAVQVRFSAENEDLLEKLIKSYRYKTTRIGG